MLAPVDLFEPELDAITLPDAMHALGDDTRLLIVRTLADGSEHVCGSLDLGVSKATRSHHLKVLREAGITRTRVDGTQRHVSLRRPELDERFPGLLDAVLRSA